MTTIDQIADAFKKMLEANQVKASTQRGGQELTFQQGNSAKVTIPRSSSGRPTTTRKR